MRRRNQQCHHTRENLADGNLQHARMRAKRTPLAAVRAAWPAGQFFFDNNVTIAKWRETERRHGWPENCDDLAVCRDAEMSRGAVVAQQNLATIEQGSGLAERELAGGVDTSLADFTREPGTKFGIALSTDQINLRAGFGDEPPRQPCKALRRPALGCPNRAWRQRTKPSSFYILVTKAIDNLCVRFIPDNFWGRRLDCAIQRVKQIQIALHLVFLAIWHTLRKKTCAGAAIKSDSLRNLRQPNQQSAAQRAMWHEREIITFLLQSRSHFPQRHQAALAATFVKDQHPMNERVFLEKIYRCRNHHKIYVASGKLLLRGFGERRGQNHIADESRLHDQNFFAACHCSLFTEN